MLRHKKELAQLGRRALIVTGRHSAKLNGSLDDVQEALSSEGVFWTLFDEVEENPSVETVMKARDAGLRAQADFVIGIGGGSAMDAAKAVALMMFHSEQDKSYLYTKGADSSAVPVAVVPTTCGTGSEATAVSVLTRPDMGVKGSIPHKIFPALALSDPGYLAFAPKTVIGNTAVDAFAHLAESYINTNATDYSRMCVREGLRIWSRSKDVLLGKRQAGPEDYRNLMNASTMAGMAICHTGTSLPHGLSYPLTCEFGIPHGRAVGFFLSGYLRQSFAEDQSAVLGTAGFSDVDEFEEFYYAVCGRLEIEEEKLLLMADAMMENQAKLKNCPYAVDRDVMRKIAVSCR